MIDPVVSICCITYNHEPFIANAIEGFLMQKTDYPYEIIIGDDCSTDKTREIIEEYANHYPGRIRIIASDRNVGVIANEHRVLTEAKGKYIAFCEGDDYWTEPCKLQRQVDFLEHHSEFSVCFHRIKHYNYSSKTWFQERNNDLFLNDEEGVEFDYKIFKEKGLEVMTVAMIYRKEKLDSKLYLRYKYYRDTHQIYHLLQEGKGYLFSFVGAVRTVHKDGINGGLSVLERSKKAIHVYADIYKLNKTEELKQDYINSIQYCIYECIKHHRLWDEIHFTLKLFVIQKSLYRLFSNIKRIIKHE